MSNNLNKVIGKLIVSNNDNRMEGVRVASINATLSTETNNLLVARGEFEARIDGGKFGFKNGNCPLQNASNRKVLAGVPLSEQ